MSAAGGAGAASSSAGGAAVVDAAAATAWLLAFAAEVAARRDELTELDAAIGDADHGVNMDRGMQAVAAKLRAPRMTRAARARRRRWGRCSRPSA